MDNPFELQRLWLYPGELAFLMEKYGVLLEADALLATDKTFSYQDTLRKPDLLLAEIDSTINRDVLVSYLNTLACPSALVRVKRGLRRRPVQISYACKSGAPDGEIILLATRPDGGAELLFPFNQSSLCQFLCGGMGDIPPLEPPMSTFMPLSPSGMSALLALADLFNQEYPYADPDWQPDVPLLFTRDSWHELVIDGLQAEPLDSLVAGFQNLSGLQIDPIGIDELDSLLLIFCNEGWIGVESEDDHLPINSNAVFYVGKDLAITLRCMAWWDLSLGLELMADESPFYAIQASINWQFSSKNDNLERIIVQAIDGETLTNRVIEFLKMGFGPGETKPVDPVGIQAPKHGSKSIITKREQVPASQAEFQWYYTVDDQQIGPLTETALKEKLSSGRLPLDGLVWREGLDQWQTLSESGIEALEKVIAGVSLSDSMPAKLDEQAVWYYLDSNQQTSGPVTENELAGLIQAHRLSKDVLVWKEGMAEWITAISAGIITSNSERDAVPPFTSGTAARVMPGECPNCSQPYEAGSLLCNVCGTKLEA